MTLQLALFVSLSVVAVAAALGMLLSANAIYSALFLVINFVVVAAFYVLLGAPFIAMVQVTVYAGAIMVLFLFVVMMLGAEKLRQSTDRIHWQQPLAIVAGLGFLCLAGYAIITNGVGDTPQLLENPEWYGSPSVVGKSLFEDYLLPFELTSLLLLVSLIGAVVLTGAAELRRRATRPSRRS